MTEHAAVLDQPLRTIPLPAGARIALVTRSGELIVPDGDTRLEAGDQLVIGASRGGLDPDALAGWLDGQPP